jgi:hypothetical protein
VAHGWATLPGVAAVQAAMRQAGDGRLRIEVAGLPEEDRGDLSEVLAHAASVVRLLCPEAAPMRARYADEGGLAVELAGGPWNVRLRALARGRHIAVSVEGAGEVVRWEWRDDRESVVRGTTPLVAPRATPPAPVRALAQLLPDAQRGDGLIEAKAVLALARGCRALLPTALPLGERPFRQSASVATRRPSDLLGRLGLRGSVPTVAAVADSYRRSAPRARSEPFELWAFRAGVKPVVFLTVRPEEVAPTAEAFGDAHVERRDRRVHVGAQDRWTDRRDEGEARVELYISRDPALARRAAALQTEGDPSAALVELGTLLGYPSCCAEAFARQDDRSNNSRNRYWSRARTLAPDGSALEPWPWELNNLDTMIAPFYPCSYRCAHALAWARRTLAEAERADPALVVELRAVLARPVLYFDHDHQLAFDGTARGNRVEFRAVHLPPVADPELDALAAAIGRGDRLTFDDRRLVVERGTEVVLDLERTDPGLGFVAPFGVASGKPL